MTAPFPPALSLLIILGMLSLQDEPVSRPAVGVAADPSGGADADGDGVADAADACPQTEPGFPVGPGGCATDSDGDGVADGSDRCPDTLLRRDGAHMEDVDSSGCSVRDRKQERPFRYFIGVG